MKSEVLTLVLSQLVEMGRRSARRSVESISAARLHQMRLRAAPGGFTLIEVMIIFAIIGILLAIAIPQFQAIYKKSTMTETQRQDTVELEVFAKLMNVSVYDIERSKVLKKKFQEYKDGRFMPVPRQAARDQ